jgi:fructoselysine 6-kinase
MIVYLKIIVIILELYNTRLILYKGSVMNLVALTPCCVDYYPQLDTSFLGGNSLNVAAMWKTLEPLAHISVITCLGKDTHGTMILEFLTEKGIDTSRIYRQNGTTACNKMRVDEQGERYGIEGAWQGGVYETFFLSESDWDHVSKQDIVAMPGNNPNFATMLKKRQQNQLLSVDYLDIENHIPMHETVAYTDIAFISARPDLLPKYKDLAFTMDKLIIVTLGAEGSYAYYKGATYYQPALDVDKVVDTTGCGDAYQAAFALTYYKTRNIQNSMLSGAQAAWNILQGWGGLGLRQQPTI